MHTSIPFRSAWVLGLLIAPGLGPLAHGQQTNAQTEAPLQVQVVSVIGTAHKMQTDPDPAPWTELKAGAMLRPHTVIRTGFQSQVVLDLGGRGRVVLDSGTKIGIAECASLAGQDGRIKARIGMKYGSMLLKVDQTRRANNDVTVSTAVATVAVPGAEGRIAFSADRGLSLFGEQGTFQVARGPRTRRVRATQRTDGRLARSSDLKDLERDPHMGDPSGGLTLQERENLYRHGSGRGILGYVGNPNAGQVVLTGSPHGHSDPD